jgi:signal-transduction protein with cAMP-binding, CBS, and nucleotidyltransferase domain
MTAAIAESKAEEELLTELENFVQLQLRKQAATKSGGRSSDTSVDVPHLDAAAPAPYPGGTAPLAPP